jgi:hypothetical protein
MRYILAAVLVTVFLGPSLVDAQWTIAPPGTKRSKEIKSMDILDRPNRPLHIYGTIVRLRNR